jgi:glycosyltransferase involved in cell wall biosynthesis
VAIVHEWLVTVGGSENVVAELLQVFPQATVFAVVDFFDDAQRTAILGGRRTKTTFIQRLPGARRHHRLFLPLMPLAIEQLDLSGYNIVISSSHAVAKGVLTGPDQVHLSYVHSPIRYAWDLQHQYMAESFARGGPRSMLARMLLHYIRMWDVRSSLGVDHYMANSAFVGRRIRKIYRREAAVIYPPVDVDTFQPGSASDAKREFYLIVSRLVPYKRVPLVVEAFASMPERRLVVVGDGPEAGRVRALAGPNVTVLGYQSPQALRDLMRRSKAFVFPAEEDFGIVVVEAQACGAPVIAYGRGGVLEIVRGDAGPQCSGVFFDEQSVDAIVGAVARFEALSPGISREACRANALRFSRQRFRVDIERAVTAAWSEHIALCCPPKGEPAPAALSVVPPV